MFVSDNIQMGFVPGTSISRMPTAEMGPHEGTPTNRRPENLYVFQILIFLRNLVFPRFLNISRDSEIFREIPR